MKKLLLILTIFLTACSQTPEVDITAISNYLDYSETVIQENNEATNVLFFHAAWCPTCRQLEKEILTQNAKLPNNLNIIKVDYDTATELKKKHKVTVQHTLVQIDNQGNTVKKWTGGGIATLIDQLDLPPEAKKPKGRQTIVNNIDITTDFKGAKVKKSELLQGCFRQDCIPSIDKPIFESATKADKWLNLDDVVFAVDFQGIQRAYPQNILNWHEIVNDTFNDTPVAITFCPLCGSALAFERVVNNVITEFGVSGKLHNSDLVMYDRYEGSLWQQISGEAIVGKAAQRNEVLTQVPIITTTWREWQATHPNTEVLSRQTGYSRDYTAYPYGSYEQDDNIYFQVGNLDQSLQIKTEIYGIEINGKSKAYTQKALVRDKVITDTIGSTKVKLEYLESGQVKVTNLTTNEEIIPIRLFWFAWAAFHPDTQLYQ